MFFFFLTTVCVKLLGLYLPLYMFCCIRASVSGLMALLVLWFFSIKYSFIQSDKPPRRFAPCLLDADEILGPSSWVM